MSATTLNPKKILIVAPAWVGDLIMAEALFSLIKNSNPNILIDVLANKNLHPLLQRMAEVNRTISLPFKHGEFNLLQRIKIGRSLIKEKYEQAIVLPNSFKSALIPWFANIPKRTGFRGEMRYGLLNDLRVLDKNKLPLMLERFLALGITKDAKLKEKLIYPKITIDENKITKTLAKLKLNLDKNRPLLALCPGAEYGPAKRWPTEYFAKIAKTKANENWQIMILGGSADQNVAAKIQQLSDNVCLDLTGKTDLGEVCDLLALANTAITNDSGLMHIAAALNIPLIAIFGSSSPKFTPPLSSKAKILSLNLPCSPCFERQCPLEHTNCLNDLKPQMVLDMLK